MPKKRSSVSDEEIIAALLSCNTVSETSKKCGLATRTLYDRMNSKRFQLLYNGAKADVLRTAVNLITGKLTEAVKVVSEIMSNTSVNPAIRLQAAQTIIKSAVALSEKLQSDEQWNRVQNSPSMFDDDEFY